MATSTKDLKCKKSGNISDAALLYIYKKGGKSGNPENSCEETPVQTDTVQRVFSDFLQSFGGHSDRTILEDPLVESEEKKEQEELSITLNGKECTLVFMDPESLINDHDSKCEVKLKNKIQEAESIVNEYFYEHEKLMREREASYQLSLAEAEEEAEKTERLNEQLEWDNINLVKQILSLHNEMEEKDTQLSELSRMYNEKLDEYEIEKQAHSILNEKYDEMKKEKALQSSVGQVKKSSKIALASKSELEHENSVLKGQIQTLQDKLKEGKEKQKEKCRMYEEKLNEEELHKADKKKKRSFFKKLKKWFRNLVR